MPTIQNKLEWTDALEKIIILTKSGNLNWSKNQFLTSIRENDSVDIIYSTSVMNHIIIVYEYRYKKYSDEDNWDWDNEVAIEFVDLEGNLEWQWPTMPNRFNLIDAIRYNISGAGNFLRDFLK
jgi:hypothetical protein